MDLMGIFFLKASQKYSIVILSKQDAVDQLVLGGPES